MQSTSILSSREIVIVEGARTPFGGFMGSLATLSATDLSVLASKRALEKAKLDPLDLDQAIIGNVLQTSIDAPYLARHVGLRVGMREKTTSLTLNRLCGSGFQAILSAAYEIILGQAQLILAGGTESMSNAPFWMQRMRQGYRLGHAELIDSLQGTLTDSYTGLPMGKTAESLAELYQISRQAVDEFSYQSQMKTKKANEKNLFAQEVAPVVVAQKNKSITIINDEHPKPQTTVEGLQKLPAVFGGVISPGSASGIVDGAASVIVASRYEAQRRGLPILGKLISHGISGCDPALMGLGPVEASRKALLACGKTIKDMDVIEINEAFAPQVMAVIKELGVDEKKLNVNGGAIALGHPLAASGTRLTLTALYELQRQNKRYALVTACIGGGQGIALVLENTQG